MEEKMVGLVLSMVAHDGRKSREKVVIEIFEI